MKISILVVLYGKKVSDSQTLVSLARFFDKIETPLNIIVWNNGPNLQSYEDIGIDYTIKQELTNKPLSKAYNWFLNNNIADVYIILDDDTIICDEFIAEINNFNYDLMIPDIVVGTQKVYPLKVSKQQNKFISIGSGLCLSRSLIEKMKIIYSDVFDERFCFYGVDVTFFYRVNKLRNCNIYNGGRLIHSLSRLDKNDKLSEFRVNERCYDLALQCRYYFSIRILKSSIKFLLKRCISGNIKNIYIFAKTFFSGKHPNNF